MNADIFCGRLKSAREMRKLTQHELGNRARLPPSSIAHFEAGSRKPSFETLRRLSAALEVTTDYLLGRVDEPIIAASGDVLLRDIGRLSANDRELAGQFLKILAERNVKNGK
ncbi:MAG: helix-turn-helix domain-containing protein [Treponema sp.]|jgi:transcriptional regulator with XRE-family HTH domain|nr:helix-turn-helix domain-containing protein [Treponema sp.]